MFTDGRILPVINSVIYRVRQFFTDKDGGIFPDHGRLFPRNGRKLPHNKDRRRSIRRL
jgi:hypothetical protein